MSADVLADHLEATHHRYLWDEMPRVTALVDKIVSVFSSPEELARFKVILANIDATTQSAKLAVGDAQVVASHVRKGKGSVGALVMDEQLFDDLQELARDLKHNPWKFFWKE